MKKKLFIIFLAVAATVCLAFGLSACAGEDNPNQSVEEGAGTAGLEYVEYWGHDYWGSYNGYIVSGIGTVEEKDIVIPSVYNGKPRQA